MGWPFAGGIALVLALVICAVYALSKQDRVPYTPPTVAAGSAGCQASGGNCGTVEGALWENAMARGDALEAAIEDKETLETVTNFLESM